MNGPLINTYLSCLSAFLKACSKYFQEWCFDFSKFFILKKFFLSFLIRKKEIWRWLRLLRIFLLISYNLKKDIFCDCVLFQNIEKERFFKSLSLLNLKKILNFMFFSNNALNLMWSVEVNISFWAILWMIVVFYLLGFAGTWVS